jgi:hypothetical protein
MSRRQRVPIVLAGLLFLLAAVAEVATSRVGATVDPEVIEATRRAALIRVEVALARDDVTSALSAWQEAYRLARQSRSWRGLVEAAEAHLRIGAAANATTAAAPRARELYLAALGRARADRSVEGALRAAEGFAGLGDHAATRLALRLAASLAARSGDGAAASRVEIARARLLDGRTDLASRT